METDVEINLKSSDELMLDAILTYVIALDQRLAVIEGIATQIGEAMAGMKEHPFLSKMFGL